MTRHLRLYRYLAYSLEIFVLFLLQQTPGFVPDVWGIRPTLLIPVALCIALFEPEPVAMWFGVACGLLIDFGAGGALGVHALLLAAMGYALSGLVANLFKTNLLTACLLGGCGILLLYLLQWLLFYVLPGYGQAGYALWRHFLPRAAYTLLLLPLAYYFNRAFAVLLRER